MNKRKIYKTIGIVTWILTFIPILFGWWVLTPILIAVYLIVLIKQIPEKIPFIWFFLAPTKRIVHSELGDFWIHDFLMDDQERVDVYKQGIFYAESIFAVAIYNDINFMTKNIKKTLEEIYGAKILQQRLKKERETMLKNWDGYLDTVARRDEKLDGIGVK